MAAAEELLALLDREIPDGRKSLQENYLNLENVAKYCEDNYLKASMAEKSHALQETQNYTTHSLASVAYQINNLATNFMKLLDLQLSQLTDMESSVHHLNQMVMIHKEKVARREIGILTIGKNVPAHLGMKNGIIYPEQAERPIRYTRKSIDYTALDDIGHGLRQQTAAPAVTPKAARSPSVCSTNSSNLSTNNSQTSKPPATPIYQVGPGAGGSIGRASGGQYRTPAPAVAPPSTPHAVSRSSSRQGNSWIETSSSTIPIPDEDYPAPLGGLEAVSPPLPPPPLEDHQDQFNFMGVTPQPHNFDSRREGPPSMRDGRFSSAPDNSYAAARSHEDPYAATGAQLLSQSSNIPEKYIEKVVAIYDYQANKPDELSFAENAVIYVVNKNLDGWWEGTVDGQTGLFPYNYVEPCM